jgi:hypothetical protein
LFGSNNTITTIIRAYLNMNQGMKGISHFPIDIVRKEMEFDNKDI